MKPLFFNYHEYAIHQKPEDPPLIITHFPNIYVPLDSQAFTTTRIVRIPRVFHEGGIPQFSSVLPGKEPGAIIDHEEVFMGEGEHEGQLFGTSSVSPLSLWLSDEEFSVLVARVNELLMKSYGFRWISVLEYVLDLCSFWVLSDVVKWSDKKVSNMCLYILKREIRLLTLQGLDELEEFIVEQNEVLKGRGVRVISPRRSGYLSLDFEVVKP